MTTSPHGRRTRRLAIAGLLGAAALTVGAGAAYAAGTDSRAVETGYAVVVDGPSGTVEAANDCPEALRQAQGASATDVDPEALRQDQGPSATDVDVSVEAGDAR